MRGPYARQKHDDPKDGSAMHFETHQPVIDDLEARILTIRDSL